MSRISANAHTVRCAPRLSQRSDVDAYLKLSLQVSGNATLSQDGRTIDMVPGDLAVYDTSRPYELVMDQAYVHRVLRVPWRQLLTRHVDVHTITATSHVTGAGIERLFADAIRQLDSQATVLSELQTRAALSSIVGLVDAMLDSWLGVAHDDDDAFAHTLSYIDANLNDLSLTPSAVAAAKFMSLRSLQAMFARHGLTPSGWIRHRRLEMCRSELVSSSARTRSVSEIARAWGFPDNAHFSRVFKAAYGECPSEARRTGATQRP